MFGLADIAYVGGSLIERGGHNPLEPAALAKPVLMGPSVYNFSDISEHLLNANGLCHVKSANALATTINQLLSDDSARLTMGHNAQQLVKDNQGTLTRLLDWVATNIAAIDDTPA